MTGRLSSLFLSVGVNSGDHSHIRHASLLGNIDTKVKTATT